MPLVLAALSGWQTDRLYLALDSSMLWNCAVHDSSRSSVVDEQFLCCGECRSMAALRWCSRSTNLCDAIARWLLPHHPDVMLIAGRGFANDELVS